MARRQVKIEGIDDLALKLTELSDPKQVGPTLKRGVRAAMLEPARRARSLIPVGIDPHKTYKGRIVTPGYAKRSIRIISKILKGGQAAYAVLGVRAEAFYAVLFVELGTSKMMPRPWLRPAFLQSTDPMIRKLGGELNEWIRGVATRPSRRSIKKGSAFLAERETRLNNTADDYDGL